MEEFNLCTITVRVMKLTSSSGLNDSSAKNGYQSEVFCKGKSECPWVWGWIREKASGKRSQVFPFLEQYKEQVNWKVT